MPLAYFFCRGSGDATKQAHNLIAVLIKDPDVDILQMLPKPAKSTTTTAASADKVTLSVRVYMGFEIRILSIFLF